MTVLLLVSKLAVAEGSCVLLYVRVNSLRCEMRMLFRGYFSQVQYS